VLAVFAAIAAYAAFAPAWNKSVLTSGVFRTRDAEQALERGGIYEHTVLFYADGVSTTVSVELRGGSPVLKNNGKVEASTVLDMPTQILVGLLPVLLHGGAEQEVFVVGYGSGITIGAIAQAPEVARLDVVELEPEVYTAADGFFGSFNHRPEDDPRVHRYVGDARNFLLAGDRAYDVIVSEPSNPWMAGVASLFSREFYHFARAHLAPGGVFCQWVQLYEMGPRNVKMIYRTFHDAFPYVYAFTPSAHSADTILVGALRPLALDLEHVGRRAREDSIRAELERARVTSVEDLFANLILGPDEIAAFSAGATLNTDDNARLEYTAPADLLNSLVRRDLGKLSGSIFAQGWPYGRLGGLVTGLGEGARRADRELTLALALLEHGRHREAGRWLARAEQSGAGAPAARLGVILGLARLRDQADPELPVASPQDPVPAPSPALFDSVDPAERERAAAQLLSAYGLIAEGRWRDAADALVDLPRRSQDDAGHDVSLLMGYVAYQAADFPRAALLLSPLVVDGEYAHHRPAVYYYAGRVAYGSGKFREGVALLAQFAQLAPEAASAQAGRLGSDDARTEPAGLRIDDARD
jgi:spermidine synthase